MSNTSTKSRKSHRGTVRHMGANRVDIRTPKGERITYTVSADQELYVSFGKNSVHRTADFPSKTKARKAMTLIARAAANGDLAPTLAARLNG